jgi:hypothetical protein
MAGELREISHVDYVKLGGAWRIKLIFEGGDSLVTFDKFASPQEAMTAFEAAVEAENVRRGHEMLERLKTMPPLRR